MDVSNMKCPGLRLRALVVSQLSRAWRGRSGGSVLALILVHITHRWFLRVVGQLLFWSWVWRLKIPGGMRACVFGHDQEGFTCSNT